MIKLGGLIDLKPLQEEKAFTATSKETGNVSVFKTKAARDAAIKAGSHEKRKTDKDTAVDVPGGEDKPKVNIFKRDSDRDSKERLKKMKAQQKSAEPKKERPDEAPKRPEDMYDEEHGVEDFREFGNSYSDDMTPEQKDEYDNLTSDLEMADADLIDARDLSDREWQEAADKYNEIESKLYDLIDSIYEPKQETTSTKLKDLLPESIINEGTRSQVGIIDRSGKIASAYVHYDGYPSNMKKGLKKHMKNEKDVLNLIKKGGARGIYNDKDVEYYNEKSQPMKGNSKDIEKYIKSADMRGGAEYVYLYNMKDKKWYYADTYEDKDLKKLF